MAIRLSDKQKQFLRAAVPAFKGVASFAIGSGVFAYFGLLQKIPNGLLRFVDYVTVGQPERGPLVLTEAGRYLIAGIYVTLLAALSITVAMYTFRAQQMRTKVRGLLAKYFLPQAEDLYRDMVTQALPVVYSNVEREFFVNEDYSITAVERVTVGADNQVISTIGYETASDEPAANFEAVNFTATVIEGSSRLLTLPAQDQPRRKRFVVVLVPPLMPGGPRVRVEFRARWPNGALKLSEPGAVDDYVHWVIPRAAGGLDALRLGIHISPAGRFEFKEEYSSTEVTLVARRPDANRLILDFKALKPGARIGVQVTRTS